MANKKFKNNDTLDSSQVYDRTSNKTLDVIVDDTGWIYPPLNTGWHSDYSKAPVRYRKIGNVVYIESFVSADANAGEVIFNLPEGFRTDTQYKRFPVYTASGVFMGYVEPGGNVGWLSKGTKSVDWFCINISFIVAD